MGFHLKNTFYTLCLIGWVFHANSDFFCNILNGGLYIGCLNTELFQIWLVVSQTLGEGTLVQMSLLVCQGRAGGATSPWEASEDCLEVSFVGLVVGKILCMVLMHGLQREEDSFYGEGGFSLCNTAVLELYCKSQWVLQNIL